ncbi:MAG: hypothetical protein D6784_02640 [Chloroflexi bacterium]|nr:MAG: hypothetical protein D6784_02640 [Chloroflexota bacterium]
MHTIRTRFFGRKPLLAEIVRGVLAPTQPLDFALIGLKTIGKSRLLKYLASPEGPLLGPDPHGWRPERFRDGHNIIVGLYDCRWPEAQTNLPEFVRQQLVAQLQADQNIPEDWLAIDIQSSPGQHILQLTRRLNQHGFRLVIMLDNFDSVLQSKHISPDMLNQLRPLTDELGLIIAATQPLHDLQTGNKDLASSPLFNVMHQHFLSLLETEAAEEWLAAYGEHIRWEPVVADTLLEMTGRHPFLLARLNDVLLETRLHLPPDTVLTAEHLPLLQLRLAEHGRPLFEIIWRRLKEKEEKYGSLKSEQSLIHQLLSAPRGLSMIEPENTGFLNWLINYAIVVYNGSGYRLFSPLLHEYLANQLKLTVAIPAAVWPRTAAIQAGRTAAGQTAGQPANSQLKLSPIEAELLRYFQAHSRQVISVDRLLADVWGKPTASPRRVQEAIRRLRNQLRQTAPPIGTIENERGRGYRFVPARREIG